NSFIHYFRTSKFVQLGDFQNRLVIGRIVQRVADDLYIDLGLKFNTVCKAPIKNNEQYVKDKLVVLRLIDPELSQRFLGANKDITLLEANHLHFSNKPSQPVLLPQVFSCAADKSKYFCCKKLTDAFNLYY
uniref:28S ribosomal protein S28, mitochondrial n=1 Tax=Syphacia muris TaxID=451379 RepID=A0A0N5ABB9_9BILA